MTSPRARSTARVPAPEALVRFVSRLLGIADDAADNDDVRLRKRVGVAAGAITVLAPWTLPLETPAAVGWALAFGLSAFSIANLAVLARSGSRGFDRYVVALLCAGVVFVPLATFIGGGVTGAGTGVVWAFLIPGYAILALGPRRATPWFVVYLVDVAIMVALDPLARAWAPPVPYAVTLLGVLNGILVPLAIVFLLLRYLDVRRIEAEARADELLTNAIPASIARRLRRGEDRIAEVHPATTVLFADIVGFTPWAQSADPARVVDVLDRLFTRFDELATASGVEKIKTIGDAYMAAAGAPVARDDHAPAAAELAVRMLAAVAEAREREGAPLEVRIGLASGPVVGGVIGRERILFDLWGDTVNTAARMESSGVAGRVQVTAATRALLGDRYGFEERSVEVKGLGRMTTYLLVPGEGSRGPA